jgi:hypothetical protein
MLEIRERPPLMEKGPFRASVEDLGAPTIDTKNVDGGALGRQC